MEWLAKQAIKKTRLTFACVAALCIFGVLSYNHLPQAEDPGFVVRLARVVTLFPGGSPTRVEDLITSHLEEVIEEIPELDYTFSESRVGLSVINVRIQDRYTDIQPIWDNLRRKMAAAKNELPEGVIGPVVNDEFGEVFGSLITISGKGFTYKELEIIAEEVKQKLLSLEDVAKVTLYGRQEEHIFVEYEDAKLAELGVSATALTNLLQGRNILTPGGSIVTKRERIPIQPSGNFTSLEEIGELSVTLPGKEHALRLRDIVTISRDYADPPSTKLKRLGQPSLGLAISMREGGNIIRMGEELQALIAEVEASYPIGLEFNLATFQPRVVSEKVHDFVRNLLQSVSIVMLMMVVTLGIRTGFVVASLIPLAILATFGGMHLLSIGLDQISLAALIISLGLLVDNAIVVTESTLRNLAEGMDSIQATLASIRELAIPLLTSSLTTIAAFLPIYLAQSQAGEYTGNIFRVVSLTLISSWVLSITVIPALCAHLLKADPKLRKSGTSLIDRTYGLILHKLLRKRGYAVLALTLLLSLSLVSLRFIPKAFFPPSDRPLFLVEAGMPPGTKIEETERATARVEAFLQEQPDIQGFTTFLGGYAPRYTLNYNPKAPRPEKALLFVNTLNAQDIPSLIERIESFSYSLPDMQLILRKTEYGPPVFAPIQVRISGSEEEVLHTLARTVKRHLEEIPGVINVRDDWQGSVKKLVVDVNQQSARLAGISHRDIAISLQSALDGMPTTQYRERDETIPVVLRHKEHARETIDDLQTIHVMGQQNFARVPLTQVASLRMTFEPSVVWHRNRVKTVTVNANLQEGILPSKITDKLTPWLQAKKKTWPRGYSYELGGQYEASSKSRGSIRAKLPIAALIILLLLVGQFNSLRKTFIILLTIPLGIIGVTFGLLVTQEPLGFLALLGLVSLSGIVVNNAIVLLDRIETEEKSGLPPSKALIRAAQSRLRPIVLTTLTTMGGLLPLWFGGGPMFRPMAVSIIFGLGFSTLLTLGFVPVLYSYLYHIRYHVTEQKLQPATG